MKKINLSCSFGRKIVGVATCAVLLTTIGSTAFAASADDVKLKELEQAMKVAPKAETPVKKPRTRAIVFDTEPAAAQPAENPQAQSPATPPPVMAQPQAQTKVTAVAQTGAQDKGGRLPVDCSKLPADAKVTAVDFVISFKVNSSEIAPSSEGLLVQIAKVLNLSPERCVLVEGHTDASGSYEKNLLLSEKRASSVVKFISEKAEVDGKRLVAVGKGPSEPMKNTDPRDPKNRRVVFKVVE